MLSAVVLRNGAISVGIVPEAGGSLARFDVALQGRRFEILRPAAQAPWRIAPALNMSSFPLIPYAGRLRAGRFEFDGREIVYPLNAPPERHASHGDGFAQTWTLGRLTRQEAVLELVSAVGAPIRYAAQQLIQLGEQRVDITLRARNIENRRIPFELGFHPYFAHRAQARISAHLPGAWNWDAELMPTTRSANPHQADFAAGLPGAQLPPTGEYFGWDGRATLAWPQAGVRVTVLTHPALSHVVIWAPAGEDFFCFEPLSHSTDSLNRWRSDPDERPPTVLEPGESRQQTMTFLLELP